jgi:hypothetical protein
LLLVLVLEGRGWRGESPSRGLCTGSNNNNDNDQDHQHNHHSRRNNNLLLSSRRRSARLKASSIQLVELRRLDLGIALSSSLCTVDRRGMVTI